MKRAIDPDQKELFVKIGQKIKQLRKATGLSYIETANNIKLSKNSYYMIENGQVALQISSLKRILIYHGLTLTEFFSDID